MWPQEQPLGHWSEGPRQGALAAGGSCALLWAPGQALFVSFGELLHSSPPQSRTVWGGARRRPEPADPRGALPLLQGLRGFKPRKSQRRCPAPATLPAPSPAFLPPPAQQGARAACRPAAVSIQSPSSLGPQSTGLDPQPHQLCASESSPTGDSESPPQWVGGDSMNTWKKPEKYKRLLATESLSFHFFMGKMRPVTNRIVPVGRQGSHALGMPPAQAL